MPTTENWACFTLQEMLRAFVLPRNMHLDDEYELTCKELRACIPLTMAAATAAIIHNYLAIRHGWPTCDLKGIQDEMIRESLQPEYPEQLLSRVYDIPRGLILLGNGAHTNRQQYVRNEEQPVILGPEPTSWMQQMQRNSERMRVQRAGTAWQRAMEQPITDDEIVAQMRQK